MNGVDLCQFEINEKYIGNNRFTLVNISTSIYNMIILIKKPHEALPNFWRCLYIYQMCVFITPAQMSERFNHQDEIELNCNTIEYTMTVFQPSNIMGVGNNARDLIKL